MEVQEIINSFDQYKSKIIEILSKNNWQHFNEYFIIKDKFSKKDFDEEFKSTFCHFYILNGARGLNKPQKNKFFELLLLREDGLEKILKALYEIYGYGDRRRLFLSFGTKLLHTINDELPIYDRNIADVLELPLQTYPVSIEERIKNRIDIYQELKDNFAELLANKQIRNYLKNIRQESQNKAKFDKFNWHDKFISNTKLLDSLLWALYKILEKIRKNKIY